MRRVMALWGVRWPRRRYARLDAYLFATTLVNRLQAVTDLENLAEQRVLERIGFRREGVLRGLAFVGGSWRDAALYARLGNDPA
jgi:RimJ/RimL family protein N-acetyltransferase